MTQSPDAHAALSDASPQVVVNPQDGRILSINPAACDWLRQSLPQTDCSDWVGRPYQDWLALHAENALDDRDDLTGLPNRKRLLETLDDLVQRAHRHPTKFACLFIDLDGFKPINDTYGHAAGDELLVQVAQALSEQMRTADVLARIGGDEFVMLLTDMALDEQAALGAERVAQQVVQALSQVYVLSHAEVEIGGSIGIAVYPQDGLDAQSLMHHADMAMYRAKNSGRNQYAFYQMQMDREAKQRAHLEADFREVLKQQAMQLVFEPVYDLKRKSLVMLDAKWQVTSAMGSESEAFSKLVETSFLGIKFSEWHLTEALQALKQLAAQSDVWVTVRVNAMHFRQKQFVSWLEQALTEADVAPEALVLELSEACLSVTNLNLTERMNALSKLGVQLHIENFGAGFASLKYLARLDVSAIKVSGFFHDRVSLSRASESMISAMMAFAYQLGMHRIANGIQNAEQLSFVESQQCDWAQGPYLGEAVAASELEDFVNQALQGEQDLMWSESPEDDIE